MESAEAMPAKYSASPSPTTIAGGGSCGKQNISRKFLHDFIGNAVNERTVGTEPVKHFSGLAGQTKLD